MLGDPNQSDVNSGEGLVQFVEMCARYNIEIPICRFGINDIVRSDIVSQLVKNMLHKRIQVEGANVLIMGLTFKENCPDLRNTKIVDIVSELKEYNINVDITDPWCSSEQAEHEYNLSLVEKPKTGHYDAIILAVAHNQFKLMGVDEIRKLGKAQHVLYDLKYILPKESVDMRL